MRLSKVTSYHWQAMRIKKGKWDVARFPFYHFTQNLRFSSFNLLFLA